MNYQEFARKYLDTRAKLNARVEFYEMIDELCREITDLKTDKEILVSCNKDLVAEVNAERWIPVEEKLPGKTDVYLITDGHDIVMQGYFSTPMEPKILDEPREIKPGFPSITTHWKSRILPEGESK